MFWNIRFSRSAHGIATQTEEYDSLDRMKDPLTSPVLVDNEGKRPQISKTYACSQAGQYELIVVRPCLPRRHYPEGAGT